MRATHTKPHRKEERKRVRPSLRMQVLVCGGHSKTHLHPAHWTVLSVDSEPPTQQRKGKQTTIRTCSEKKKKKMKQKERHHLHSTPSIISGVYSPDCVHLRQRLVFRCASSKLTTLLHSVLSPSPFIFRYDQANYITLTSKQLLFS